MLNKVILIGNVGKEPEVRAFPDTKVANLTLATTEKFKDKQGNLQDATEWHNLQVWGKLAEIVEKYVKKGAQIYVEGKIKQESYKSYRDWETDRKSTRLNSSHSAKSRMPSSA